MKHFFRVSAVVAGLLCSALPVFASGPMLSLSKSTVTLLQQSVVADGQQEIAVEVYARNELDQPMSGAMIEVEPAQAGSVRVSPALIADAAGKATFTLKSTIEGSYAIYALVNGSVLIQQPVISFVAPNCPYTPGRLVKLPDDQDVMTQIDSTVYYYGKDCKRHAFSNQRVFDTWYANFDGVQVVSAIELANMPLGKNVTYRPGIKLVKFVTSPATYVVAQGGILRQATEEIAISFYGANWNTKVDDISDAFYSNYLFGQSVTNIGAYSIENEKARTQTIDATF
ncbi:MAG: Ig-like domain-containing protein [Patescibacteria group bacterium]